MVIIIMETLFVFLNVNLATYRQFTNAACDWIIQKKKRREKKRNQNCIWAIPIPISTRKDVICCSNGYIYHFLDYIKLLLFVNANVIIMIPVIII